jgi:hypothetical protein
VDERVTALLAEPLELGILHLATDHWEYLAMREDPDAWDAFTGALRYARWLNRFPDVDELVAARRTNRVCPVCAEPLETLDVKERPVIVGGVMTQMNTHRTCTPGEMEAAA